MHETSFTILAGTIRGLRVPYDGSVPWLSAGARLLFT